MDYRHLQTLPGFRHDHVRLSEVTLHCVSAGAGPLVVLLHGFPDCWYSWRFQLPALVAAGFRVIAPDLRGYGASGKPAGVAAYHADRLAQDIRELIAHYGDGPADVCGHDWGAGVAWVLAMNHAASVRRLVILNLPHPRRWLDNLWRPGQLLRSWYMFYFQLPWLPERSFDLLRRHYFRFEQDARAGAFTAADLARYADAHRGLATRAAMINYYRAALRRGPRDIRRSLRVITAPTRVIWGERDRYIDRRLARPDPRDVPDLVDVQFLPEASHWVQHDAPEAVTASLIAFFGGDRAFRLDQIQVT